MDVADFEAFIAAARRQGVGEFIVAVDSLTVRLNHVGPIDDKPAKEAPETLTQLDMLGRNIPGGADVVTMPGETTADPTPAAVQWATEQPEKE